MGLLVLRYGFWADWTPFHLAPAPESERILGVRWYTIADGELLPIIRGEDWEPIKDGDVLEPILGTPWTPAS